MHELEQVVKFGNYFDFHYTSLTYELKYAISIALLKSNTFVSLPRYLALKISFEKILEISFQYEFFIVRITQVAL